MRRMQPKHALAATMRKTLEKTYCIFSLVLAAAAGLALNTLPPQSFDPCCELRRELQTGWVP